MGEIHNNAIKVFFVYHTCHPGAVLSLKVAPMVRRAAQD